MASVTRDQVLEQLKKIHGPDGKGDLVSSGVVENVLVNDGKVIFSLSVAADRAKQLEPLRALAEQAVASIEGVEKVTAVLTAEASPGKAKPSPAAQSHSPQPANSRQAAVAGVNSIIAVASGKGGVGKSTTSVNLALGLAASGLKVGILDADIYGPSMPRMLGLKDRPEANGKILKPLEGYGLKVMSIGFLVEEDTPMIWRGPMVISAITQMLREVEWGQLDVLVVDMPPGTGDAQLTMAQQVPLAGAVIVSTPQDIALIDARKGLNMFRKVEVPILGLIENMSYFLCPSCGERSDIFGHGGAREEATRLGLEFLGAVPLHMDIRKTSDGGNPITISAPDSEFGKIYRNIADNVLRQLQNHNGATGPEIVFE